MSIPASSSPPPRAAVIIPARGGSKRLPRKNIQLLLGRPMIDYSIAAGLGSRFVGAGNVYVSTDDAEIADIARASGAQVIARPPELARDDVWTEPVIQHAVQVLEQDGSPIDIVIWMNACAPEVQASDIDHAVERLLKENLREVFAVDEQLRSTSIVRAVRREALFQGRLSVKCAVMILPYVDIHYQEDLKKAEARLVKREKDLGR